ncbi:MAG: iron dependent repressor, metal binding and dimerization domain protein [Clostridium sp.]|nr:iron dependent repressor, metal binding and dimerization domain protein [Clostridium sp.]
MGKSKKNFHTVRGYENINLNKKLLTPSMEDYLEMIYRCSDNEEFVRLNKIAQMLNVRDSSASKMMKKLGDLGLIKYEKYGVIILTEQGRSIGSYLLIRHNIIDQFFRNLGKTDDMLSEIELIEHVISSETVENMYLLNKFFEENNDIVEKYNEFKKNNKLKY